MLVGFSFKINKRAATLRYLVLSIEYLVTRNKEKHDKKNFLLLDCNINWEEQKTSCGQCVRNIIHDSLLVDGIFCRFHTHW